MKNKLFAVLLAVATLLLGGCATGGMGMGVGANNSYRLPPGCVPAPQKLGQPQECWDGRLITQPQGNFAPVMQAGANIGKCELVGGAAGAVGGALIGGEENRGIGAIIGGLVGAFAGNKYCESEQQQVQQVMTQPQNRCSDGKVWAKLAWPGHPQDGNMVCMAPDDSHRAGNSTQPEKVASAVPSRCKDGKVWAKLAWQGHPQDGNMVCMLPDDPHKGE